MLSCFNAVPRIFANHTNLDDARAGDDISRDTALHQVLLELALDSARHAPLLSAGPGPWAFSLM